MNILWTQLIFERREVVHKKTVFFGQGDRKEGGGVWGGIWGGG